MSGKAEMTREELELAIARNVDDTLDFVIAPNSPVEREEPTYQAQQCAKRIMELL